MSSRVAVDLVRGVDRSEALSKLHGVGSVSADGVSPLVNPEIRRDVEEGRVRVLVEVRVFRSVAPQGEPQQADTVASRHGGIAAAQRAVLSRLPATHFSVIRQFDTAQFLALELDSEALRALENTGALVARVMPDEAMAPAARP